MDNVNEYFKSLYVADAISRLSMINFIEEVTKNYNWDKLLQLYKEFDQYEYDLKMKMYESGKDYAEYEYEKKRLKNLGSKAYYKFKVFDWNTNKVVFFEILDYDEIWETTDLENFGVFREILIDQLELRVISSNEVTTFNSKKLIKEVYCDLFKSNRLVFTNIEDENWFIQNLIKILDLKDSNPGVKHVKITVSQGAMACFIDGVTKRLFLQKDYRFNHIKEHSLLLSHIKNLDKFNSLTDEEIRKRISSNSYMKQ